MERLFKKKTIAYHKFPIEKHASRFFQLPNSHFASYLQKKGSYFQNKSIKELVMTVLMTMFLLQNPPKKRQLDTLMYKEKGMQVRTK